MMRVAEVVPFRPELTTDVAAICAELQWPSYADEEVARRGRTAPESITIIALDPTTRHGIGFVQILTDGVVQAFLAQVGVLPTTAARGRKATA